MNFSSLFICPSTLIRSKALIYFELKPKYSSIAFLLSLFGSINDGSLSIKNEIASFSVKPDFIAVEPPDLIGGDVSVSTAKPELISDSVKAVHAVASIPVITGAGIKNSADARKALELGTEGVFVASGIVKAQNPEKAIDELLEGFK